MNAPAKIKSQYATRAKVRGFVELARDLGIDVAGFEVTPNGTIRVVEARATPQQATDFDRFEDEL